MFVRLTFAFHVVLLRTGQGVVGRDDLMGSNWSVSRRVWFEDKGGWDMTIHIFRDMDIYVICLVNG